jgi:hypothetical protein
MNRMRFAVAVAVVALTAGFSSEASAQEADRAGASVAGYAGFGFLSGGAGAAFEFGARGGYTLPMHLYVGGDLGFQVASYNIFHIQGEVGYDIGLTKELLLRPYAGLGFDDVFVSECAGGFCASASALGFVFSPGAVVTYAVTPNFFVGGDARIPILLGGSNGFGTAVGFDLLGTGGYKF